MAPTSGKRSIELLDEGPRVSSGLMPTARPFNGQLSAAWYAASYRYGRRVTAKPVSYPALSVVTVRAKFASDYTRAKSLNSGANPGEKIIQQAKSALRCRIGPLRF